MRILLLHAVVTLKRCEISFEKKVFKLKPV